MESMIYEQQAHEQGFALVCGVDEAGAGPLMGPLYAAAVILPEQFDLPGLNDSKKLTEKKREAMQLAIDGLPVRPELALIDGNRDHGRTAAIVKPHRCIVDGDALSASIAAASILAKVSRDRYVCDVLDKQYPEYQFARHKGYGTKLHYEMLDQYGVCPEHRISFLKSWFARKK